MDDDPGQRPTKPFRARRDRRGAVVAPLPPPIRLRLEPKGVLRLMPLSMWARTENGNGNGHEPAVEDDLQGLIAGFRVPTTVAAVTYPRGCRIRRVRVKAPKVTSTPGDKTRPVILSRRALRNPSDDVTS